MFPPKPFDIFPPAGWILYYIDYYIDHYIDHYIDYCILILMVGLGAFRFFFEHGNDYPSMSRAVSNSNYQ